jgi:hypothetical protein
MHSMSRRDFSALLGWSVAGVTGARAQFGPKTAGLPNFPIVGDVAVADVRLNVLPNPPPVLIADKTGCQLGLLAGIHIRADVTMQKRPGTNPADFGVLRFLQILHFRHMRSPSFIPGLPNAACAQSHATRELDGQYPYLNRTRICAAGLNTIDMADGPHVETELPGQPDESLRVEPLDRFQTWLIWETTDDNRHPTPADPARLHALGRVDWGWTGVAGNLHQHGTMCDSTLNSKPANGWNIMSKDSSVKVTVGRFAGTPPPVKSLRLANMIVWGKC